ncbi:MAG: VWA domain-containing protein [Acidimicrobiia bacterium]|nr:VWA domain-containing protein [Acidimicrobiia bacterium]
MLARSVSIVFLALSLSAQQSEPRPAEVQQADQPKPIQVSVQEVIVPVTVTDDQGRFVSNLEEKDFKIFDEGKLQSIKYFNRERNQPVVVGFLIDISNANRLHWKTFREAAIDLVNTLLPGEKKYSGYLISYGNEAELQVNTSHDPEKMMDKLRKIKPGGGAALYDAVYMACTSRELVKGEPIEPRRIIVIIGDGHDSASKKGLDEVLELAQRNLVTIYGVSTVAFGFNVQGEKNLTRLAEETGGRVEYPLNKLYKDVSGYLSTPSDEGNYAYKVGTGGYASEIASGLFRAIANVAGEITTQYVMRYVPSETDMGKVYRTIHVEVPLPNVKIRHRKGYYPFQP